MPDPLYNWAGVELDSTGMIHIKATGSRMTIDQASDLAQEIQKCLDQAVEREKQRLKNSKK